VIHEALTAQIPVVILGDRIEIPPSPHLALVLSDVDETGRLAALRLNDLLQGSGEIAILGLDPESPGSIERSDALVESLKTIAPRIQIVARVAASVSSGFLEQEAERVIQLHPDVKAIVALNAPAGYGAAVAIRSSKANGPVKIIVCDQSLQLLTLLRQGAIDSIIVQNMRAMASQAIADIVADKAGKQVSSPIYVRPSLVTESNIDQEPIQQLLLMHRGVE
jgi:ribose transport system substrate-binding protein